MIKEKVDNLKQVFESYSTWEDRYRHIIKVGKKLDGLDQDSQIEKYRIRGCQSQVWLKPELVDGKVYFYADSDAVLVKGIIGILIDVYSGASPVDILNSPPDFLKELGISEHLSMNRTNGLASMVRQLQMYASAFGSLVEKGVNNAAP